MSHEGETPLFAASEAANRAHVRPLAARLRPTSLDEFVGQEQLLGEGKLLRRLIAAGRLGSLIFYGPPGTGKTTLARLLAVECQARFRPLSAVTSGVKQLREELDQAHELLSVEGRRTILFVDELHRFNRVQQDALLPDVEEGIVSFVGATTANPFFAVISALVSRSRVFEFTPLQREHITTLLRRALADCERGLGRYPIKMDDDAIDFLADVCDGDARQALSALEVGVLSSNVSPGAKTPLHFTRALAEESVQRKAVRFDPTGDDHYDVASALIKSIRGSDPDASLYWLARMLESGEDVRFVVRRLVILASEDIGNADPHALPLAVAAMQACEFIGLPECQLTLSQLVTYLALAPKSNAASVAIEAARRDIREGRTLPVPMFLRDAHYAGARRLGHGQGYQYAHDQAGAIGSQDYLGVPRRYYHPVPRGFEQQLQQRMQEILGQREQAGDRADRGSDTDQP